MKSSPVFLALPVVSVGLVLALSTRAIMPESWLWIMILGMGLSGLIAISSGLALSFTSVGEGATRSRRFFPGLLPVSDDPVETESNPVDTSPETDCSVWDGF